MISKEQRPQFLSSDRPIVSVSEDLLGRGGFAKTLSATIAGWVGKDSLVIALYGGWGSGKSSLKNLLAEDLHKHHPEIQTIDFNPWTVASRPIMLRSFLDDVGIAIGRGDVGTQSSKNSMLNWYRRFASRLQGISALSEAIRKFVSIPLILVGVTSVVLSNFSPKLTAVIVSTCILATGLVSLTKGAVEAFIKFMEAGTDAGEESLSEVKNRLSQCLRSLKAPILFIVDDLDRLAPQELLEVIQLIKANADFPNFIYLLLVDREIMEKGIADSLKVDGRDYLEKIIQVGFDLPSADTERVHQVFIEKLNSLMSAYNFGRKFDHRRWGNIFASGISNYFTTLRDVNRFISTLAFQAASFEIDGEFEVNSIDLIVLETIRVFEPEVYKNIKTSKDLLLASRPEGRREETHKASIGAIISSSTADDKNAIQTIISQLFPNTGWALNGPNFENRDSDRWYRDLRICSPAIFDRYFRLNLAEDDLSRAQVSRLLKATADRSQLTSLLENLASEQKLLLALNELSINIDEIAPENFGPIITSLFDVGYLFPEKERGMFETPISWRAARTITKALDQLETPEKRVDILSSAYRNSTGLGMASEILLILSDQVSRERGSYFVGDQAEAIREAVRAKILQAVKTDQLKKEAKLARLLHLLSRIGAVDEATRYASQLIENSAGTVQLLESLVLRTFSHSAGDSTPTVHNFIRRGDIEPLVSMDNLNTAVARLDMNGISDDARLAVQCFLKAMKRRDSGESDDDPFAIDEDD